jgi:hypothetical protein
MAGMLSLAGRRIGVTDSSGPRGALFPSFLLGKDLLDALLPPPAPNLEPTIECSHTVAATGGEDVEIPTLWLAVHGLRDEVCPDADSSQHHGNLQSDGPVSLDSLPSVLWSHLFYLVI